LESFHFQLRHRSGSHTVFAYGKHVLSVPFRKPFLKKVYVQLALAAIDEILADRDQPQAK
jgi:hypothetical protein